MSDPGKSVFRRVLLKLSGEALMGDSNRLGIDPQTVDQICREVAEVARMGVEIGIIIGGGNIFRGLSASARGSESGQRLKTTSRSALGGRRPSSTRTAALSASIAIQYALPASSARCSQPPHQWLRPSAARPKQAEPVPAMSTMPGRPESPPTSAAMASLATTTFAPASSSISAAIVSTAFASTRVEMPPSERNAADSDSARDPRARRASSRSRSRTVGAS